jgi:peptidoglycan/xylan/chitin deacetylase (PgdA/CDA1 family)
MPQSSRFPFPPAFWVCLAALAAPLTAAAQPAAQAVILQYHHISTATPPVTSISPADFRVHMEYLRDNGFTVLALETVVQALRNDQPLPDRTAVLTFDDGYASVHEAAFPLLRELGWPFTIFVTAGLITSNPNLYASWEQLREMAAAGATLANHTVSHPYFLNREPGEDDARWLQRIEREITEAEDLIASETGQSHRLLAYPYGEYDPAIQALVTRLGYVGIAQHSGPINGSSDFTALPRFPFSGIYASMNSYPVKVNSLAFDLTVSYPDSPVTAAAAPEAVLDFNGDYRLDALACFNNDEPMQVVVHNAATQQYRIKPQRGNSTRRFRYNCTAPGSEGRYYWYSVPWVNPAITE